MLKNINPILCPDLIYILRAMGHGDSIAIVDANYPAESADTQLVRNAGSNTTEMLDAILSVMPLDTFVDCAALHMEVVKNTKEAIQEPEIFNDFRRILAQHEPNCNRLGSLERFDFYERVKESFAVVATGEHRLYGNILLIKGIISKP